MFKLIQNKDVLSSLNKYMFTGANMKNGFQSKTLPVAVEPVALEPVAVEPLPVAVEPVAIKPVALEPLAIKPLAIKPLAIKPLAIKPLAIKPLVTAIKPVAIKPPANTESKPFTPFQKDKLFWCFYIILKGYEEYEMNQSNGFSVEKQLKIETVEKLKGIKEQLKELKLKRTELEDELVNKQMITMKGLSALCLVHNVSITYFFGRKYCQISPPEVTKKGIIIQNDKKEDSLKWTSNELNSNNDFVEKLQEEYWFIENIQKPLKAPSAYTLTDLQTICQKLLIQTHEQVNEKTKAKTKTKLYEEILECI